MPVAAARLSMSVSLRTMSWSRPAAAPCCKRSAVGWWPPLPVAPGMSCPDPARSEPLMLALVAPVVFVVVLVGASLMGEVPVAAPLVMLCNSRRHHSLKRFTGSYRSNAPCQEVGPVHVRRYPRLQHVRELDWRCRSYTGQQ